MKRIVSFVLLMLLWTSIGFAEEKWEPAGTQGDFKLYVDSSSISLRQTVRSDLYKAKIKSINDSDSSIRILLVNRDTKEYSYVSVEIYHGQTKTLSQSFTYDRWIDKDYEGIGSAIDKVIELGNK